MADQFVVWVDDWQMQCCGDPFSIGSRVTWTLDLSDVVEDEWLITVLGEQLAPTVTHREEHHGGLPDDAPETSGTVTRIRAVCCAFAPLTDEKVLYPVAGTGVIEDVDRADGRFAATGALRFNGYVVDLLVD